MSNSIDKVKFTITPTNQATALMNSGFVPNGAARKNGWEEVRDITDNLKLAVTGLYRTVLDMARDVITLGGGNEEIIMNIYRTIPQDVQITTNTLLNIDKQYEGKTGFFVNDDSLQAQQIILDYNSVFEKVHVLTASMLVEIQEILLKYKKMHETALMDTSVVSDVEVKSV